MKFLEKFNLINRNDLRYTVSLNIFMVDDT